jgi:RNA polymerase sigma-70 factor (ECF subfamily)
MGVIKLSTPPASDRSVERRAAPGADRTPERVFDELLVTLAQGGDAAALDRLARRWRPRHYAHARRLLRSPEAATDAVQEAWVGVVRGLGRLVDPARFPAWSFAIVTRRCRDQQRRAVRTPAMDADVELAEAASADLDTRTDLRRALAALPADQRAAIALFYLEGLAVAEIASALSTPVGTIKTRLFHARRTLRRCLEGDMS